MTPARFGQETQAICLGKTLPESAGSLTGAAATAARVNAVASAYRRRQGQLEALEVPAGQEAAVAAFLGASGTLAGAYETWARRADEWARAGGGGAESAAYRQLLSAYGAVQDAQTSLGPLARAAGAPACSMEDGGA